MSSGKNDSPHPLPSLRPPDRSSRIDFQTTSWSKLGQALTSKPDQRQRAISELFQTYWKPVYAYLRKRHNLAPDHAQDLTQDFFVWTLESDFFQKAKKGRGSFRWLLKTALSNYTVSSFRKAGRKKRGGGTPVISLDFDTEDPWDPPQEGGTPEEVLDQQWRTTIVYRALEMLKKAYEGKGKELQYRAVHKFYVKGLSYDQISKALNISIKDVENYLTAARKRLFQMITDILAETVTSQEDLQKELKELFK